MGGPMSKRVKGYPDRSVRDALAWAHQIHLALTTCEPASAGSG